MHYNYRRLFVSRCQQLTGSSKCLVAINCGKNLARVSSSASIAMAETARRALLGLPEPNGPMGPASAQSCYFGYPKPMP
jgi:hypothetical protein